MKFIKVSLLALIFASCQEKPSEKGFVGQVEEAHKKEDFLAHQAISFSIDLKFGGKERLKGKLTLLTGSGKGLIEYEDGKKIYQVNEKVFYSPDFEQTKNIRFDAYTWSYFFLFPYKLSDEGTVWQDYENPGLNGHLYEAQKLMFESGTGDAPEDWYVVYADTNTHLIEVASYIVTAHKSKEEAEKDPHAIKYEDYVNVNGVPIATKWTFWGWDEKEGLTKQLGEGTLSDVKFVNPEKGFFHPPLDFKKK